MSITSLKLKLSVSYHRKLQEYPTYKYAAVLHGEQKK